MNNTATLRKMLPPRDGLCGTLWDICPRLLLMSLCCRWWTSWWTSSLCPVAEQVIDVPKISLEDIPARRLCREPQLVEQLVEVPTVVSYTSFSQRTVEQTVDNPASRGRGRSGGLQGFFPGQSTTAAAVDISVPRGDLQGFLPGQGSTASSSHSPDAENEAGEGVFRTFPRLKKSAASAAIPSPIVPASVSPWTPAAYEDLDAADEPAELEDDAEPLIEEEEDPSGWSAAPSASGRPFFWHRISRRSVWKLPPGASVRKKKGRRKRKKRRKRRTPRSPRPLLGARARRRLRQWHVPGFPCDVSPRAVFPSGVVRLKMLRIMAGLDQKDYRSGMDNAGFAGDPTPRAVSFLRGCLRILRYAWFATGYMQFGTLHPVSSGKYSGTCVFTAPVAEPTVMSFTVPLDFCTIVATTFVVTSYSSSPECSGAARVFASRCRVVVVLLLVMIMILFGTV